MTVRILIGDVRDRLAELPDESVHCVVTSPPYWGLRDYGVAGQIGIEAAWPEYVETMVGVFREVRRVLRRDGTLWLNLGDCYATGAGRVGDHPGGGAQGERWRGGHEGKHGYAKAMGPNTQPNRMPQPALKPKDLVMMPARIAIALQEDGWWLRSEIIWHKPNPMPESITDRPTSAHEKIYLLSRSERYWYDAEAVKEPMAAASVERLSQDVDAQTGSYRQPGKTNGPMKAVGKIAKGNAKTFRGGKYTGGKQFDNNGEMERDSHGNAPNLSGVRNLRNVWTIATQGFSDAHFATFPPELPERCIKAGTSERGCCPHCGAGWVRQTKVTYENPGNRTTNGPRSTENRAITAGFAQRLEKRTETLGWMPACKCPPHEPVPATVLDPFGGAGTTGLVADRLKRNAILIELNPAYAEMARKRIHGDCPLFSDVA